MRPLTEEETLLVFEKLKKYIGENLRTMMERPDGSYVMRLHNNRIYYLTEEMVRQATSFGRDQLMSMGTCLGKITKSGKFRLQITALHVLSQFAKHRLWVKPAGEQSFTTGNHILKSNLGRITENTDRHIGVVVYTMADVPIGFGVTARSTTEARKVDASQIICFWQSDIGEFLRHEDTLF